MRHLSHGWPLAPWRLASRVNVVHVNWALRQRAPWIISCKLQDHKVWDGPPIEFLCYIHLRKVQCIHIRDYTQSPFWWLTNHSSLRFRWQQGITVTSHLWGWGVQPCPCSRALLLCVCVDNVLSVFSGCLGFLLCSNHRQLGQPASLSYPLYVSASHPTCTPALDPVLSGIGCRLRCDHDMDNQVEDGCISYGASRPSAYFCSIPPSAHPSQVIKSLMSLWLFESRTQQNVN